MQRQQSMREFKDEPVEPDVIEKILETAQK